MPQSNERRRELYAKDAEYREKQKQNAQNFRRNNPEYTREYYLDNKEYYQEHNRQWKKDNSGRNSANAARYRARKLDQTPPDADKELIDKIYENRPEGHHVDHIVALANGGPHHQDNLQYLTASDNCSKGAR